MPDHQQTDDEHTLIQQAAHHPEAFRQLYRRYFPRVFSYIAARMGSRQDAEDVTSTVFMRIVSALPGFDNRGPGTFAAWVFRIASNEVAQFYRSHRQERGQVALSDLPEIADHALAPDDVLVRKELFGRIRGHISTLSARRQEVIMLRFFAGLRNQEIAEVLELDERTVASHLARALDDLRSRLQVTNGQVEGPADD
ncbi:MAG: sigma-70 family RNA polymerase sigma factor [Anaerolineae bacterium]|nr:sigma-70 family RNA polymerase sigma factor [Anaerolineae bacterium]